jgi:hypothetical protein
MRLKQMIRKNFPSIFRNLLLRFFRHWVQQYHRFNGNIISLSLPIPMPGFNFILFKLLTRLDSSLLPHPYCYSRSILALFLINSLSPPPLSVDFLAHHIMFVNNPLCIKCDAVSTVSSEIKLS